MGAAAGCPPMGGAIEQGVANEVGDRHAAALPPSTAWPRPDDRCRSGLAALGARAAAGDALRP